MPTDPTPSGATGLTPSVPSSTPVTKPRFEKSACRFVAPVASSTAENVIVVSKIEPILKDCVPTTSTFRQTPWWAWLAFAGAIMLAAGLAPGSAAYDAALHALMLGFVFSMVFGHAPIIFPAVLRVAVPYHPLFYAPLALLHLSLAVRLAGDLAGLADWRSLGGLLNALALAAFILNTIAAVIRGKLKPRSGGQPG